MKLLSPAKINLFLQISGKRSDGYHELVSLMCPVSLFDVITMDFGAGQVSVHCSHPEVPEDRSNLALKAVDVFSEAFQVRANTTAGPVSITIEKRIPVGAGLGGGSSNAATVLLGLNQHYDRPFTDGELARLGLRVGADVPFFLFGKPAVARGIGEELELFTGLPARRVVLVYPGFGVSTAAVYNDLNLALTKCEKKLKNFAFRAHIIDPARLLCNDLESVTERRYPEIRTIKDALVGNGAEGALMTGSGSAVFGLFSDDTRAQRAYQSLSAQNKWQVFLVDMTL